MAIDSIKDADELYEGKISPPRSTKTSGCEGMSQYSRNLARHSRTIVERRLTVPFQRRAKIRAWVDGINIANGCVVHGLVAQGSNEPKFSRVTPDITVVRDSDMDNRGGYTAPWLH
jgi:hypothetical protein